ncbi:MAG TPA: site-specific DNA-methyltransferase [Tepidisphaeraceae bacterium]|nr:site-specific DNA-methyltransferase [Tepidisphaeraceae bacterium]
MNITQDRKKAYRKGLKSIGSNDRAQNLIDGLPLNQICQGDSIQILNNAPEGWVDLVFADPPFNIGYLYHGYDDQKDVDEYVNWSETWMRAVHRALKPTGSFYLAIGDEFVADLCHVARRKIGFHMRNWIIWHYTFGQQTKKMFAKSHTHILYFTKEKPDPGMTNLTFNADAVRVASARQTTYADARANPKGKLPDDTWFLRPQETAPHAYFEPGGDVWYESRVCGTFKEREGWHGCQMPIGVLNRIILASSNPGDVVLDPFNGSGTTVVSAALLGRQYVGIDQSEEYVGYARKRLEHALTSPKTDSTRGKNDEPELFDLSKVADPMRSSRVMTETDAFGRPRVQRKRNGKAMKDSRRIAKTN